MELISLRRELHRNPETAGGEIRTADILEKFLISKKPDSLVTGLGGHGLLAVYRGRIPGKTVLFRCDTDAVPVDEEIMTDYSSQNQGVSHKCGHDGHMAILAGVADHLCRNPLERGTALLLFQPAEETGQGAAAVLSDPKFRGYEPDIVFALHNLPGFPMGAAIVSDSSFASASVGLKLCLTGRNSHAAEPEKGISPAGVLGEITSSLQSLSNSHAGELVTVTHISMGKPSYGVSPGSALLLAVLRAPTARQMNSLLNSTEKLIRRILRESDLSCSIEREEEFPAVENNLEATALVRKASANLGIPVVLLKDPFPWSEDFGHFTDAFPGALFGLGAGMNSPPLHNACYDFPEQIIRTGVELFVELLEVFL